MVERVCWDDKGSKFVDHHVPPHILPIGLCFEDVGELHSYPVGIAVDNDGQQIWSSQVIPGKTRPEGVRILGFPIFPLAFGFPLHSVGFSYLGYEGKIGNPKIL